MVLDVRLLKLILINSFIYYKYIAHILNLVIIAGLKIIKEHIKIKKINKNNSKINKNA